ncbi:short-chain dehydrogenase/reductase SDR [Tribonema minus]|uniref:Short-chain dehydrogenase/reductase SDR n=1 Tax=Tribonema minus TaxID=303371 RepID=A0A835YUN2_9STRA|nr:short-chain dehydrogenase/reductase SDR [Tribonema minus]
MAASKRFEGRVALVTGASSGMGLATARQLAAEGAQVVMVARTQDKLEAAAADIKAAGGDVLAVAADVSTDAANEEMVKAALSTYGKLHVAFLNAGTYGGAPVDQVTEELFNKIFDANVKSVAFGLKHVLPAIERSGGGGSVVVNSSCMGLRAPANPTFTGAGLYAGSKAAADMIMRYAAIEASKHKTRVNSVAPGIVRTELMGEGMTEQGYHDFAAPVSLVGRAGTSNEVSALVCFLASDEARFITGSVHEIDGGWRLKA